MNDFEKINEAAGFIKKIIKNKVEIGIMLGSGLGGLVNKIKVKETIPYKDIPYFPVSTVDGHAGNLNFGGIGGKNVIAFQGRFHLYEGYSANQIALPIRTLKFLGAEIFIESNAAGGLNPLFKQGDVVIISDHINFQGVNPLVGENDERIGVRFPDMSEPYSRELIEMAEKIALEEKIPVRKGVLAGLLGPNLETKAEYRFLRSIGSDMVTMSTIPEVIAANHAGLKVFGVSVITDMCLPDALKPASFEEIIKVAMNVEPLLTKFIEKIIIRIN
ncbi:MAG: purine-nucleoside phosphorylase [Candidatus Omnitrophica bacterium]|nr:purine-nucleoside phosphorylase [Candidatus Omnitrophota bacterium]